MAVDFSIQNLIAIISQVICGGNIEVAGLLVMMVVFFIALIILAMARAPVTYALVPMIPLAILFASMQIVSVTLSFFIILATALFIAIEVRRTVAGE